MHLVQFGQAYIKNDQTHESGWFPEFCPKCEEEFAREKRWREELEKQNDEIAAETYALCAADEGRSARIKEEAGLLMAEDAGKYVLNYFHENRAKYEAHVEEQDWNRVAQEVSAKRGEELFERMMKKVGS